MILKDKSTKIKIKINNTTNNIGLDKNDTWQDIRILIQNKELNLNTKKELITKKELEYTIKKINTFIENSKPKKERISFIKNYFVIYLETIKKQKQIKIKIINLNNTKKNYLILLNKDEIKELINNIEIKKD